MANAEIQRTFDVTADGGRFASFIDGLRGDLRDQTRPPLYEGLNRLRPYTDVPQQWLRLTVSSGRGAVVVLWLRTDNLYTIGFVVGRQGTPATTWEFNPDRDGAVDQGRHLIDGSRFLGFTGGYTPNGMHSLHAGVEAVGWKPLQDAIEGLAAYQGDRGQGEAVRGWLRTVVVTFSESIRSREVAALIDGLLKGKRNDRLTARQIALINNWESISTALFLSSVDPTHHPEAAEYRHKPAGISNNFQARQVLGIVYVGPNPRY